MNKFGFIVASAFVLTACGPSVEDVPLDQDDQDRVDEVARTSLNKDQEELKEQLAKLQAQDPTVKDLYYGVNEDGEKVLNVVRDDGNGGNEASVWPLLGGMAAGMLIANMLSAGGVGAYSASHPPYHRHTYSYQEERRRKNAAAGGYAGFARSQAIRTYRSSPSFHSKVATLSTRTSGAFASSSSARAGGYSSGG